MKVLLHICCAPCAVYPFKVLEDEMKNGKIGKIDGYFYNPNIHPEKEFKRRIKTLKQFADIKKLKVHFDNEFLQEKWESFKGTESKRCMMCYIMRMKNSIQFAKENGYDAFTTTLLVSPYQKHQKIIELCSHFAKQYGIEFLYRDFRDGFRKGQKMAREMGLYTQKYCGCIISYNNSPFKKKIV